VAAVVLLGVFAVGGIERGADRFAPPPAVASYAKMEPSRARAERPEVKAKDGDWDATAGGEGVAGSGGGGGVAAQSYEGLPAKIEIPGGVRQAWFTRELLSTEQPRAVYVVMIAARVLSAIATGTVLLLLALAFLLRRPLAAAALELTARVRAGGSPAAAGA
jgi:hypothetical protein